MLEQEGLVGVKFLQRRYNLVQLGLHVASDKDILAVVQARSNTSNKFQSFIASS